MTAFHITTINHCNIILVFMNAPKNIYQVVMHYSFVNLTYVYEPRSVKTGLNDIEDFLCKKTLEKHQILRNLTSFDIALKPIQADSKITPVNIFDKIYSLSYPMFPWQRFYLSNCQNF